MLPHYNRIVFVFFFLLLIIKKDKENKEINSQKVIQNHQHKNQPTGFKSNRSVRGGIYQKGPITTSKGETK